MLLFAMIMGIGAVAFVGFGLAGTYATGVSHRGWFGLELLARLAAPAWMAAESLRYYGQMKKRVAIGLGDPLVANRFLLWGIGASFGVLMIVTSVAPVFLPTTHVLLPVSIVILGISGLGAAIPYWLAFFPPRAYRRRFEPSAA